ncbi:MAG: hypothetical protein JWO09_2912 [Bacteroidetes bacterium]|nr:hypothetical protein [Bacteroidota bacterium]
MVRSAVKCLLPLIFCLSFNPVDSQEDAAICPMHYVRIDIVKSPFAQLHFSYERYNGKKAGWEIGLGWFYPMPGLANEFDRVIAFKTHGLEADLQRKFYADLGHVSIYFSPMLRYAFKRWKDAEYLEDGSPSSSFASWSRTNGRSHNICLIGMFGFDPLLRRTFNVDVHIGFGIKYQDLDEVVTAERYSTRYKSGHSTHFSPVLNGGIEIGFGFKGKRQSA